MRRSQELWVFDAFNAGEKSCILLSRNRRTLSRNDDPGRSCAMQRIRSEIVFCKKLTGFEVIRAARILQINFMGLLSHFPAVQQSNKA